MTAPLSVVLVQNLHPETVQSEPGLSVLAAATLYVAVASTGLLAAPALTCVRAGRRVRVPLLATVMAAYVALLCVSAGPGEFTVARSIAISGLLAVAASSLLLAPGWQVAGAGALVLGQLLVVDGGAEHHLAIAVHLVAAAVWVGGVAHLALFASRGRSRMHLGAGVRRFSPYAVTSATLLCLSGYVLLLLHRVSVADLPDSSFGALVLSKSALLLVAAVLGAMHRRVRPRGRPSLRSRLLRVESLALATALGLAVVLTGTAGPAPAVQVAAPGLAVVDFADAPQGAVFVTALTADSGAVRVLSDTTLRVVDRLTHQAHDMSPGEVAQVELRDGLAHLEVATGWTAHDVDVPAASAARASLAGAATADPSGRLDYQLGRSLGAASTRGAADPHGCPAPTARETGRGLGEALLRSHIRRVTAITDNASRAQSMTRGLVDVGVRRAPLGRSSVAVVATDASGATAFLRGLSRRAARVQAVYLAPWLLDGRVLSLLSSVRLPPLVVASTVDPMSPVADRYRAALATTAEGTAPTVAGLLGYESVVAPDLAASSRLTLYAATPVGFLPGVLEVGHDHSAPGWFTGGTLVPTSAPTTVPVPSCNASV